MDAINYYYLNVVQKNICITNFLYKYIKFKKNYMEIFICTIHISLFSIYKYDSEDCFIYITFYHLTIFIDILNE
jgi:hypothetical protein